jgi:hypothetical protein
LREECERCATKKVSQMVPHLSFSCDRPTNDLAGPAGPVRNPIGQ